MNEFKTEKSTQRHLKKGTQGFQKRKVWREGKLESGWNLYTLRYLCVCVCVYKIDQWKDLLNYHGEFDQPAFIMSIGTEAENNGYI